MIFELLGVKVEEVNMSQPDALVKVKTGEVAATVFVAGRPISRSCRFRPEITAGG